MNKRQKEVLEYFLDREEQVIRGLKAVYRQAIRDCEERIRQLSTRSDMENIQSIVYQTQYQQAIQRQLEGILDILQTNEFTTISDYLNAAYQNGFAGALYDLHGQGIPLLFPIDQDQVTKAVLNDSKLSVPMYTRLGEEVNTLKLAVRAQISRGIANGSTWNQMAQELAKNMVNSPFQTAQYNAMRIARTEGHRIQQQSQYDAMRKAKEHGADVVKEWNATLDARTRPDHMSLDGQIREIDQPFTLGSLKAQYPGEFGRPEQDIHCRCCALQRARWALGEKELEQLKERAKYLGLDQAKDFGEFQKRYLDSFLTNAAGQDTTQAAVKLNDWHRNLDDFLEQTGLDRQASREMVNGFGRSQAGKAVWTVKKYETISAGLKTVTTSTGISISDVSTHVVERCNQRQIAAESIVDALTNPLKTNKIRADHSQQFVGESATVVINTATGKVVTVWPTSQSRPQSLKRKKENGS